MTSARFHITRCESDTRQEDGSGCGWRKGGGTEPHPPYTGCLLESATEHRKLLQNFVNEIVVQRSRSLARHPG